MAVESLSPAELHAGIRQLISAPQFAIRNPHLGEDDMAGLLSNPLIWPTSPVFSPYATTHHGYSQTRCPCHSNGNWDIC